MQQIRMIVLALLGVAVLASAHSAYAVQAQEDDLKARVATLEARLAQVESQSGAQWLTEQRAIEIRALVQDVLVDADIRASLLQSGMTGGHDGKYFLATADGNYRLNVGGQIQVRYVYNFQDDDASDDSDRAGFEIRRTKLAFDGHVFDPTWEFEVVGAFDRSTGSFVLEDSKITKDLENDWSISVGQFKSPFMREELASSKRQLAVDRSLVNEEFNQDRSQGIQIAYQGDNFGFKGMYGDGFKTANTGALAYDTEWAFTGRAEYLASGTWKQFSDFTSWQSDDFGFLLGAAAHVEKMEFGTTAGPEEETFTWTVDASAEFGGANLFGAFVMRSLDEADLDQWGAVVQGGFFVVPDEWELFARYEFGDSDVDGEEDLSVVTAGVNRYWNKHNLKWTTDIGIALDEVESRWSSSGAGWRSDADDADNQFVIRSQFQLLF